MNRDLNGSLNIRQKGIRIFYNAPIPAYLMRGKENYEKIDLDGVIEDQKIEIFVEGKKAKKVKVIQNT